MATEPKRREATTMAEEAPTCRVCGEALDGRDVYEGICSSCREDEILGSAGQPQRPKRPPRRAKAPPRSPTPGPADDVIAIEAEVDMEADTKEMAAPKGAIGGPPADELPSSRDAQDESVLELPELEAAQAEKPGRHAELVPSKDAAAAKDADIELPFLPVSPDEQGEPEDQSGGASDAKMVEPRLPLEPSIRSAPTQARATPEAPEPPSVAEKPKEQAAPQEQEKPITLRLVGAESSSRPAAQAPVAAEEHDVPVLDSSPAAADPESRALLRRLSDRVHEQSERLEQLSLRLEQLSLIAPRHVRPVSFGFRAFFGLLLGMGAVALVVFAVMALVGWLFHPPALETLRRVFSIFLGDG